MNKKQKITGCITTLISPILGVMYFIGMKQDNRSIEEKYEEDKDYKPKTFCIYASDYINSTICLGGVIIDDIKDHLKHKKYIKISNKIEKLEKKRRDL